MRKICFKFLLTKSSVMTPVILCIINIEHTCNAQCIASDVIIHHYFTDENPTDEESIQNSRHSSAPNSRHSSPISSRQASPIGTQNSPRQTRDSSRNSRHSRESRQKSSPNNEPADDKPEPEVNTKHVTPQDQEETSSPTKSIKTTTHSGEKPRKKKLSRKISKHSLLGESTNVVMPSIDT